MSTLKYKGFQGSVDFDNGELLIQLLHIDDTITTTCLNASEAQSEFEGLVDEYLDICKAINKEPCKPFKGTFNVRVKPEVHKKATMLANDNGMSLNSWVEKAIEEKTATFEFKLSLFEQIYRRKTERKTQIQNTTLSETENNDYYYENENANFPENVIDLKPDHSVNARNNKIRVH